MLPEGTFITQVLDFVLDTCNSGDGWPVTRGAVPAQVGAENFKGVLRQVRGEGAVREWQELQVASPWMPAAVSSVETSLGSIVP